VTTHPCVPDHPCDHCYLCDVVGVCCATVSSGQRAQLEADLVLRDERLREAIMRETARPRLSELVRQEAQLLHAATRLSLCAPPAADPLSLDSRKEPIHVIPARSK
jgi:hypothetical protein